MFRRQNHALLDLQELKDCLKCQMKTLENSHIYTKFMENAQTFMQNGLQKTEFTAKKIHKIAKFHLNILINKETMRISMFKLITKVRDCKTITYIIYNKKFPGKRENLHIHITFFIFQDTLKILTVLSLVNQAHAY